MGEIIGGSSKIEKCYRNRNGLLHRLDGPAIESANGTKEWLVDGKHHRLDGPAIEAADGSKTWWIDGKLHRLDGPAIEAADGSKSWWIDGKLHRLDGPAIEYANSSKSWWIDGYDITNEVELWMKENKIIYPWNEEIQTQFKLTFAANNNKNE